MREARKRAPIYFPDEIGCVDPRRVNIILIEA